MANRFRRAGWIAGCVWIAATASGCNWIETTFGGDVVIEEMVAGQSVSNRALSCWLTFDFKRLPDGVDPTDVKVRFESIALREPAEFDWRYIATHDVERAGERFGSGHRPIPESTPGAPPPLNRPLKVKFELPGKEKIEDAPTAIWLNATIYWGGQEQDSDKRRLDHAYSRTEGGFF